ncbi:MAG: SDR family oxidoreductase [Rhodospirillales bacterium]
MTGAARGLGRATAERLLAEGAEVLLVDLLEIAETLPDGAKTLALDVTAPTAAADIANALGEGPLDFLVNNAGIGGSKALLETSDADWDRFLLTDLTSIFRLCRDLVPCLPRPGGRIVNISSVFALTGFPGSLSYSVAKAGVAQLTRQIAVDLAPAGILVNAVAPGVIETEMTRKRIANDAWYRQVQVEATPLGRLGQPDDIAGVVAFLCSDDAAFMTGQVLTVDGGWLEAKYLPGRI